MKKVKATIAGRFLNAREKRINDDYEWCLRDDEIRKKYAGLVVVVHGRRIWGAGNNHGTAWAAARDQSRCPAKDQVAFVVVPPVAPTR